MIRRFLLSTSLSLTILTSLSYATDVSGDIWGEWTSAGNPYNVIGDLRVPPGSTLVVGPGCYIEFQGQFTLLADTTAVFQVEGNETDSVTFTAADTTEGWGGIRLLSADTLSFIEFSVIKYGGIDDSLGHGEIYSRNCHLKIENCLFKSSLAFSGETIHIYRYNTYEIRNNIFSDNSPDAKTAISVHYHSGGIIEGNLFEGYHDSFVLDIASDCLIRNNIFRNNQDCTVIFLFSGSTTVEKNIISENSGIIFWPDLAYDSTTIRENIITDNYCEWPMAGGIIYCTDTHLFFINNTVSNNSGGPQTFIGTFYEEFWAQPATLTNNIIWGNDYEPDHIFEIDSNVDFSISYSDIQGNWGGGWNIDADPMFVDTANGDFHLLPSSPCIDAGDPASPLDPDGTIADMGALYFDQTTGIGLPPILPRQTALYQNYPNPFNANTNISFTIPAESNVTINIFDLLGRKVCSLLDKKLQTGEYTVNWDGRSDRGERLSSGVYFYNLMTDSFEDSKKMVILE